MPKELITQLDCSCIDAPSILELRQGLELLKDKYNNKAISLIENHKITEAGSYYRKIRKVNIIINHISKMKACL